MIKQDEADAWKLEAIHFDGTMVLWSFTLGVLTFHGVCSSYIPLAWVLFPLIIRDRVVAFLKMAFKGKYFRISGYFGMSAFLNCCFFLFFL